MSAKEGTGVAEVLEAIVERVPPPKGDPDAPLAGPDLRLALRRRTRAWSPTSAWPTGTLARARAGPADGLGRRGRDPGAGRVPAAAGAGQAARAGRGRLRRDRPQERPRLPGRRHDDGVATRPATEPLPGYKQAKPLVFAGIYPLDGEDYPLLRDALEKLHLNDASISFEPESSVALGFGFRVRLPGPAPHGDHPGAPGARVRPGPHRVRAVGGVPRHADQRPRRGRCRQPGAAARRSARSRQIAEPWVKVSVVTPSQYIGTLMELATNRRGTFQTMEYLDPMRVLMTFELPLAEVIVDFYDQLKSRTPGLRLDGLRGDRLPSGRPRQARRAGRTASRSTRCR